MPVAKNIRDELIRLCSDSRTRTAVFTNKMPTKWHPEQAINPEDGQPFTRDGAWTRVVAELSSGCHLNPKVLDIPAGKTGYEFHFADGRGVRIYVKLQITSGRVVGRSFHVG